MRENPGQTLFFAGTPFLVLSFTQRDPFLGGIATLAWFGSGYFLGRARDPFPEAGA